MSGLTTRSGGAAAVAGTAAALALLGCGSSAPPSASAPAPDVRAVEVSVAGLAGTLELPTGSGPFPVIVLVGGSGPGDRDETVGASKPFRDLALGLASRGIATVRYDKRTSSRAGMRASSVATFTPTQEYVSDAVAAIKLVRARSDIDRRRVFVLGHSQGGTFAPRIATARPGVAGVILFAGSAAPFGATFARQTRYLAAFDGVRSAKERSSIARAQRWARLTDDPHLSPGTSPSELPGRTGPRYWLDLTHYDAVATARDLPQPLLVLQGGRDYQVTVADDLRRWKQGLAGRSKVTLRVFPRANHLFINGSGRPNPAEYSRPGHVSPAVTTVIARWIRAQAPHR